MCVVSRFAQCCGERGRVGAFRNASTPCSAMCAVTDASGGIARANSVPGCNREADYQQSAQHPVLKSAPMRDTPCGQYISRKKMCESNKADSQAHIDGFYLCYRELKIP